MIGGFCDAHCDAWTNAQVEWFEALLEEQDVDIVAWAMDAQPCPAAWDGAMMQAMRTLDFVPIAR